MLLWTLGRVWRNEDITGKVPSGIMEPIGACVNRTNPLLAGYQVFELYKEEVITSRVKRQTGAQLCVFLSCHGVMWVPQIHHGPLGWGTTSITSHATCSGPPEVHSSDNTLCLSRQVVNISQATLYKYIPGFATVDHLHGGLVITKYPDICSLQRTSPYLNRQYHPQHIKGWNV